MTRCLFFPCADAVPLPAAARRMLEGCCVFLTARTEEELAVARAALPEGASFAGSALTPDASLQSVAPAAVACAEALGGIDGLLFAPALSSKERLFLDVPPDDFAAHAEALEFFFNACKCALPYMMGRERPAIAARIPKEPSNITERMYAAALSSMLSDMEQELGEWGISVERIYD